MTDAEPETQTEKLECPLRRQALARPRAPALIAPDETLSYAALDRRVSGTARRLGEQLPPGRVALLLPNGAAHVVLLWALWRAGRVAAPLSTRTPPGGLPDLLRAVDAGALVTDAEDVPSGVATFRPGALLVDDSVPDAPVFFERDQPATAVFTSGSTAAPKAALHSLGNHYYNALGSRENIALEPGDRWLLSLPLYHVGGLAIPMRCFEAGAGVVVPAPDVPLARMLEDQCVTHVSLVATQLRRLLERSTAPSSLLKAVLLGGGAIPATLTGEAHRRGWPIHTSYGLTEMASQVTTTPPGASLDALRTSGRLLPHRRLRLSGDGEIQVRGRTLFLGYLQDGMLQASAEGGLRTGDRGAWTDDGLLRVTGRVDRAFVSGGENIQPEEIEAALQAIAGVRRAAVVAVPDDEYGKRPVAFVQSEAPGDFAPGGLARSLERVLPRFKLPDRFYAWPDDLTDGMKPDRRALTRRARKRREDEKISR